MFAAAVGSRAEPAVEAARRRSAPATCSRSGWARSAWRSSARPRAVAMFVPVYLLAYLEHGAHGPDALRAPERRRGPTARATLISAEALATQGGALVANLAVARSRRRTGPRSSGRSPGRSSRHHDARGGGAALPDGAHRRGLTGVHPHLPASRFRLAGAEEAVWPAAAELGVPQVRDAAEHRGDPAPRPARSRPRCRETGAACRAPRRAPRAARASGRCSDRGSGRSRPDRSWRFPARARRPPC